jgi:ATP-binding cassette subfamily B multidrug efflux pump
MFGICMTRSTLTELLKLLRPHRTALIGVVVVGGLVQSLSMLGPYCEQVLIDKVYRGKDVTLLNTLVAAAVAVTTAALLMRVVRQCTSSGLSAAIHLDLSVAFYDHLQHLPVLFFESERPGQLAGRFEDLSAAVRSLLTLGQAAATNIVFIICLPPLLFRTNARLALAGVFAVPVTAYLTRKQTIASHRYATQDTALMNEVRSLRIDTLNHVRWIKGLSLEEYCRRHLRDVTERLALLQCSMYKMTRSYGILLVLARTISISICIWLGWRLILAGTLTLGHFVAFMSYLYSLYNPVSEVVTSFSTVQQSLVTCERIAECLEQPREDAMWYRSAHQRKSQSLLSGDIRFESVTFRYLPGVPVLEDVNVSFRMGSINAVLGPSGCGKTTLLRLIIGFHRSMKGRIAVGGIDISDVELGVLRSYVSVVWQDNSLLSGTLWENLTLGNSGPSRRRVDHIVEICQLSTLIASLPSGYETRIGAEGMTLSAGQRQRLAIAQALLRNTPVVLLDEATAHIDAETEGELLMSLATEVRDKLVLLVTHRESAAVLADRVFLCQEHRVLDVTSPFKQRVRRQTTATELRPSTVFSAREIKLEPQN